jgi:hypothetical protein
METGSRFRPEKLVLAVLISRPELKETLLQDLSAAFGPADYLSDELDFTYTRYYDREMGTPIRRFFVSFRDLISPERLAEVKVATGTLEDRYRREGKRGINLDPGCLSASRFILASTKDSSHRIPLRHGIYAEITLMYEGGAFRPLEWTYPDYRSPDYLQILKRIRTLYREQLRQPPPPA